MDAEDSARIVVAGTVGGRGGSSTSRAEVGRSGDDGGGRVGGGAAPVDAGLGGSTGQGVGMPRVAVHDLAVGVEGLDFNVLVAVGHSFSAVALGNRAVGGLQRGGSAVDQGAEGQIVKDVAAVAPDIGTAVLAQTLVVEAVDGSDLARFVVAANQGDAVGVADLQAEKEKEGLERVKATVDKVAYGRVSAGSVGRTQVATAHP